MCVNAGVRCKRLWVVGETRKLFLNTVHEPFILSESSSVLVQAELSSLFCFCSWSAAAGYVIPVSCKWYQTWACFCVNAYKSLSARPCMHQHVFVFFLDAITRRETIDTSSARGHSHHFHQSGWVMVQSAGQSSGSVNRVRSARWRLSANGGIYSSIVLSLNKCQCEVELRFICWRCFINHTYLNNNNL